MPSHYFHHIAIDKHGNRLTFVAGISGDYKEIDLSPSLVPQPR